jgi:hypothetical protein
VIQHIVLFTPKAGLTLADRQRFARTTAEVLGRSSDVSRFTIGRRVDIDPGYPRSFGDRRFDYSAVLEFVDRDALVRYLVSPSHGELGRQFWEACQDTIVVEVDVLDPAMLAELE